MASYSGSTVYWTLDLAKVMTWLASSPPYELHRALREMKSIVEESSYSSKDLGRQSFYRPLDATLGVSLDIDIYGKGKDETGFYMNSFYGPNLGVAFIISGHSLHSIHKDSVIQPPLIERETGRLGLNMYLQNPVKS